MTFTRLDVLAVLFDTECHEPGGSWRTACLQDTLEAREAGFKAGEGIGSASNKAGDLARDSEAQVRKNP